MIEAFVKIIRKWDEMLLQSGTAFQLKKCYKVGRRLLQSGTAFCYKVERNLLQSGTGVREWDGNCYKVGKVLQSGTIVTKWALTPC